MILILLVIATLVFSGAMIFGRNGLVRSLTVIVSFLVIAGGLIGLVGNDNYHWGMHQVTTTRIQDLTPVRSKQAALLIKPLGHGSERVVTYRVNGATKSSRTPSDTVTTTKLTRGRNAQVQLATTRWQYDSDFMKKLFALGTGATEVVNRQFIFTIPTTWQTVTLK